MAARLKEPRMAHTHAGAVYYSQVGDSAALRRVRADTERAFRDYDALGFKRWFRGGRCLEIHYSYAMARAGYTPLDFYGVPVINFNVSNL